MASTYLTDYEMCRLFGLPHAKAAQEFARAHGIGFWTKTVDGFLAGNYFREDSRSTRSASGRARQSVRRAGK